MKVSQMNYYIFKLICVVPQHLTKLYCYSDIDSDMGILHITNFWVTLWWYNALNHATVFCKWVDNCWNNCWIIEVMMFDVHPTNSPDMLWSDMLVKTLYLHTHFYHPDCYYMLYVSLAPYDAQFFMMYSFLQSQVFQNFRNWYIFPHLYLVSSVCSVKATPWQVWIDP